MKKAKRGLLLKLALFAFFIYASVQILELQIQIGQKREAIGLYKKQNEQLTIQNESLQHSIDKGLTDEQVEKIAGEKLGLFSPEETVFIGIN